MKKIFTFLVLAFSVGQSFAEGTCLISNNASPALLEYVKTNQTIIKNITTELSKAQTQTGVFAQMKNEGIRISNSVFSMDSYYSSFIYYAVFPISNEIPPEVKRDYRLLENEYNGIKRILDTTIRTGKLDVVVENPCNGAQNCRVSSGRARDLLQILLENNTKILDLYRNTVTGEVKVNDYELSLVTTNFQSEIETYYNPSAYGTCSKKEGGFWDRINKKKGEITSWQNLGKNGIQKWKDAWATLTGKDTNIKKQQAREKQLLMQELSRQGIYGDQQQNMLNALDKFNQGDTSIRNAPSFIENSWRNIQNAGNKLVRRFENMTAFLRKEGNAENNPIPILTVTRAQINSDNTSDIKSQIHKMYLDASQMEAPSEYDVSNLLSQIIKSHIDIADAINTLTISCEKAVQVCKQQDVNRGDCGKCN